MKTHYEFSMAVWRRRMAAELVDLLAALGDVLPKPGSPLLWAREKNDQTAMRYAAHRLQRAGLITMRRPRGQPPLMTLTATGKSRVSELIWPERWWRRRWTGEWFVFVYDVPEKQRPYRKALQGFLRRMRLGCLQRSVWITPRDIRPEFDDLREAAAVADYAVLFKAQTTLGQSGSELAARAWDFDRLNELHTRYLAGGQRQPQPQSAIGGILAGMRLELHEYCQAMDEDPLLPEVLYPPEYQGRAVVSAFRRRLRALLVR